MNGYLDDGLDDQPYANFSLAEGVLPNYTVVVYVNGDGQNTAVGRYWIEEWTGPLAPGTVFTDQVGITSNGYAGAFEQAGTDFPQTATPADVNAPVGNYLVFTNLTARNIRIRSAGNGDPEDFGRGPLNAFQILDTGDDPGGEVDGLPDRVEVAAGINPNDDGSINAVNGPNGNPDADFSINSEEFARGTDLGNNDIDNDGYFDEQEIALGTNTSDPASKPALPEVLGFWSFDDQGATVTVDLSNNRNDGTVVGEPVYAPGHTGRAGDFSIDFDGFNDAVTTQLTLSSLPSCTMSGWVKFDSVQSDRSGLFGQNDLLGFDFTTGDNLQLWSSPGGAITAPLPVSEDCRSPQSQSLFLRGSASPVGAKRSQTPSVHRSSRSGGFFSAWQVCRGDRKRTSVSWKTARKLQGGARC